MHLSNAAIYEQSGLTRLTFDLSGDVVLSKNLVPLINSNSGLLIVEVIEKSGCSSLIYDAGSLLSLSKFLRQNRLDKARVIQILKEICFPIVKVKDNGLYPENYSYDPDHIFIDMQSCGVKLTYFPFETGQNANQSLKALLAKLVGELLNPVEGDTEYITKIMDCYKQSSFSLSAFCSLLNDLDVNDNKQMKKKVKDKNRLGFFARLFRKSKKPKISAPDNKEKSSVHTTSPRQTNGTEILLPDNETGGIDQTAKRFIEISITANGMSNRTEIKSFPCVLGRSQQEANIVLEDNSVSRKHAVIDYSNGLFVIIDNNSSNGLVINGVKLSAGTSQSLNIGDVVKFGRIEVKIKNLSGV